MSLFVWSAIWHDRQHWNQSIPSGSPDVLRRIFALFFRSVRSDARSLWFHSSWFLLLTVIYFALCIAQVRSFQLGAPGLNFFRSLIYLDAAFVTLLGISFFSSVISEEKEEDTLGLMTMAGISPIGILLGKSTTRFFQVLLLLAVQYPLSRLSITLGGLMPDQIYAAYAALFSYTLLLANVGLFCSVVSRRNRDAAGLTILWLVAYGSVPFFALAALRAVTPPPGFTADSATSKIPILVNALVACSPVLGWISQTSILSELSEVTQTGYQFTLTPQIISNTVGGVVFFLLSCLFFNVASHEPSTEATTRGLVPGKVSRWGLLGTGRTWRFALVWKDFHFISGGWFGISARILLYVGLYWLSFVASFPWNEDPTNRRIRWNDVTWGFQVFVVPLFAVDCALCASRIFHEEIRHQTLASLLMMPTTVLEITYYKIAGCLLGLVPGMFAVVIAFRFLSGSEQAWYNQHDPRTSAMMIWLIANLVMAIHLCAAASVYLRWGAMALAIGLTFGSMILSGAIMQAIIPFGPPEPLHFEVLTVLIIMAIIGCHFAILLRLPKLGER
jgi:hypothetical protein